jgi:peptidoglycan/LPS O-acetylase OafA/YrhL
MTTVEAGRAETPSETQHRLPSLTGLRFVAAFMVFAFHATWYVGMFPGPVFPKALAFVTSTAGNLGVSFFFILSGFVLAWSARKADTAKRFWRRRFFRVYPNHLVMFFATLALFTISGNRIDGVWQNLLLIQSWWHDTFTTVGVNGVSWSLSCEAFFYLCFPLLIAVVRRIRPERLWAWTGVFVAGVVAVPLVAQLLPSDPQMLWSSTPMWQNWFVFFFPVTRMLEFVVGMLVARIVQTGRWINVSVPLAATLSVLAYIGSLFCSPLWSSAATMVVPMSLLIAAVAVRDIEGRPTFLARKQMVWLGNVSFAFYLVHWQVIHHLIWLFGGQTRAWTPTAAESVVALAFPVTLLLAWALHALVERPLQKRFSSPRRRPAPDAVTA